MYYRLALVALGVSQVVGTTSIKESSAQPLPQMPSEIREIGKRAFARARRAFMVGPYVAGAGAMSFDGDPDGTVSFGIHLTKFDISIFPNRDALIRSAKSRFAAKFAERMAAAAVGGRTPDRTEMKSIATEVAEELKKELLLELAPKRFERPSIAFRLEGGTFFDAGSFDLRFSGAIGISRLFVGSGLVLKVDDGAAFVIPAELSLPIALGMGKRSPFLDVFARVDFAVTERETRPDVGLLGVRLLFDFI